MGRDKRDMIIKRQGKRRQKKNKRKGIHKTELGTDYESKVWESSTWGARLRLILVGGWIHGEHKQNISKTSHLTLHHEQIGL